MALNKTLICLAFVLDKMLCVTPIAFLLRRLSRGNIEGQIRVWRGGLEEGCTRVIKAVNVPRHLNCKGGR